MNNKKLIIVFAVLLGLYLVTRWFMSGRESTFDSEIVKVDTSAVTEIRLYPKSETGAQVTLKRNADGWTATKGEKTIRTSSNKVNTILAQLAEIQSDRIVSRSEENWAEYEVGEGASRVEVYENGKKLADFVVGAFKFDQAKRSASSYIRRSDEDAVYLVDGFMAMTFNQGFNTFRNQELIRFNREDIREVARTEGSERIAIRKDPADDEWYRGGMELIDSARMAQYLTQISNVNGGEFVEMAPVGNPVKSLELSGNNLGTPLKVDCYILQDTSSAFVLHSSSNPDAWFASDSNGVYQRIFQKFEELLIPAGGQ